VVVVWIVVVVLGGVVVVVVGGFVVVVVGGLVVVVVVGGLVVVVVGGFVVVVGGLVVGVGGLGVGAGVFVVGVVLRIGVNVGAVLGGDGATGVLLSVVRSALRGEDGIDVCDDVLPGCEGADVVVVDLVVTTIFTVVVVLLVLTVGTVVVTFTCWKESVGGDVAVSAKAHTAPATASTATTSPTPGYQTPS
jgi:hypothetical protein